MIEHAPELPRGGTAGALRWLADRPGATRFSIDDLLAALGDQGFGLLIFALALPNAVPGPLIRPIPRNTVTPALASRSAASESSRPPVTSVRRDTASAQGTPRLAESSREFDGRQARKPDSPPIRTLRSPTLR